MSARPTVSASGPPAHWFPQTKLQRPRPRGDLLVRARLVRPLHAALQHARLVLISAPAGSGKTTLLATALADLPRACAWVSLDSDDNDLARFLAVLLAALDQLAPGAGAAAPALAQALAAPAADADSQLRRAVATLINAVMEAPPAPGLLVLDDLHVIDEPSVHAALAYLIEQLPAHLSLAVATRHDPPLPLARLRARRELLELRLGELRFTTGETGDLLADRLGLPLSPGELSALHQRTEGWAAGLSLLAASLTSLSAPDDRARFLAHLAQTDRYLFDYLAEEVLDRQDPVTRTFLLETAVLAELTPQACRGLTGFDNASAILDDLYRRNLFLVQLLAGPGAGEQQASYRYHDLFRAFLLERLRREAPEWLRDLHRRAVAHVGDPLRAIEHLVQAELWDDAAAAIEAQAGDMLARGAHHGLQTLIGGLPAPAQAARPRLRYLLGVCAWRRWDAEAAAALLEGAAGDLAMAGDTVGQGEALVFLSTALSHAGALERAKAVSEQALLLPLAAHLRVQLLAGRAWQQIVGGAWPQAADDLDEALAIAERAREARAFGALSVAIRGSLMSLPGGVARIARLSRMAAALPPPADPVHQAAAGAMRAWSAIWRGRWDEADAECRAALELCAPTGAFTNVYAEVYLQQPVLAVVTGDMELADQYVARLLAAIEPQGVLRGAGRRLSFLHAVARARWLQGRHDDLRAAYRHMRSELPRSVWPTDRVLCAEVGALVHLADGRVGAAIEDLRAICHDQPRLTIAPILGDPRLHLAHAHMLADRPDEARAVAGPALAAMRREGAPGRLRWQGAAVVIPILRLFEDGPNATFAAAALAEAQAGQSPP